MIHFRFWVFYHDKKQLGTKYIGAGRDEMVRKGMLGREPTRGSEALEWLTQGSAN